MSESSQNASDRRGFARPIAQRTTIRFAKEQSQPRFEKEALGGRLWHPACQSAAANDLPEGAIPNEFPTAEDYIATFDPLVLEEAREGVKNDWTESCAEGNSTWQAEIKSVERLPDGWATLRVSIQGPKAHRAIQVCRKRTVVVLTLCKPPVRNATEWAFNLVSGAVNSNQQQQQQQQQPNRPGKRQRLETLREATISESQQRASHNAASSECLQNEGNTRKPTQPAGESSREPTPQSMHRESFHTLQRHQEQRQEHAAHGDVHATNETDATVRMPTRDDTTSSLPPEGCIVAGLIRRIGPGSEIEIRIHPGCEKHEGRDDAPCAAVLQVLESVSKGWWMAPAGMLVTSEREFHSVHALRDLDVGLLRYILNPSRLIEIGRHYDDDDVRRRMWPQQAAHPAFIHYLKHNYDYRQLEAIEMAACHLGSPPGSNDPQAHPTLPFVLIQGPPGTGKTHTVVGVLNVWHLVAYQRYYAHLVQQAQSNESGMLSQHGTARPSPTRSTAGPSSAPQPPSMSRKERPDPLDMLTTGDGNAVMRLSEEARASKPRILVCTPSNAACDELLSRIMGVQFCDGNGKMYRPHVVRVASDEGVLSDVVKPCALTTLTKRYSDMSQAHWQRCQSDVGRRLVVAEREAAALHMSLAKAAPLDPQSIEIARRLVERVQLAQRLRYEVEKLDKAGVLVWNQGRDKRDNDAAIAALEELLLGEAEMVFATLSSTQRDVFKKVTKKMPFRTVLIDEAGQSSEVAALQPLAFGARQVVLVGDPQQLPATILSEAAKAAALERSLFERLQSQGCPVMMLTVQYRMDPDIRSFPSRYFYHNRLEDASAIKARTPAPYHSRRLLGHYMVFDVASGQERRGQQSGSLSNAAEAEFAVCLVLELRRAMQEAAAAAAAVGHQPPSYPSVAVITPYREQRKLLQETFTIMCGKEVAKTVAIQTIDSYQGRQVDVVLLSCVRAGNGAGLGFVNDVRRMNVAITRAKRSLWVLGAVETLKASKHWDELIRDAEARELLVRKADARQLFPSSWQQADQAKRQHNEHQQQLKQQQQQQPKRLRHTPPQTALQPRPAAGAAAALAFAPRLMPVVATTDALIPPQDPRLRQHLHAPQLLAQQQQQPDHQHSSAPSRDVNPSSRLQRSSGVSRTAPPGTAFEGDTAAMPGASAYVGPERERGRGRSARGHGRGQKRGRGRGGEGRGRGGYTSTHRGRGGSGGAAGQDAAQGRYPPLPDKR